MRADAVRNRERLLAAAVTVILEHGPDAPVDAVARHAGVGIGTLYRHFPERPQLLDAVARHVLAAAIAGAEQAMADATDGHDAVRRYLHAAVDAGVGVLNLIHPALDEPDWPAERTRMAALLGDIIQRGVDDGTLRPETAAHDIVFAVIRFSRPVAIGLTHSDERALAARHLDIYVDGLGTRSPAGRPTQPKGPQR